MPTQKQDILLITRVHCFHTSTKVLATHFGACPISSSKQNTISFATAQAPFSIRDMLSALESPLAFSIHSVSKQIVLFISFQGVSIIISGMITETHNIACRLIMKASLAGCLVHMDAGSTDLLAQKNLQSPEHSNYMTSHSWLFDAC